MMLPNISRRTAIGQMAAAATAVLAEPGRAAVLGASATPGGLIDFEVRPPCLALRRYTGEIDTGESDDARMERFFGAMHAIGVDRAVISGEPVSLERPWSIPNEAVAEVAGHYPQRLVGCGAIEPAPVKAAQREVERCAQLGLAGVSLQLTPDTTPQWLFAVMEVAHYRRMFVKIRPSAGVDGQASRALADSVSLATSRWRDLALILAAHGPEENRLLPKLITKAARDAGTRLFLLGDPFMRSQSRREDFLLEDAGSGLLPLFASRYPLAGFPVALRTATPPDFTVEQARALWTANAAQILTRRNRNPSG